VWLICQVTTIGHWVGMNDRNSVPFSSWLRISAAILVILLHPVRFQSLYKNKIVSIFSVVFCTQPYEEISRCEESVDLGDAFTCKRKNSFTNCNMKGFPLIRLR